MYSKTINKQSYKEMYDYLHDHFTYYTMNSWNGLRSIANNVKLYNLDVDTELALRALEEDDYCTIDQVISDWEDEHPGYKVGFNGRSGGYLVLYREKDNQHVFEEEYESPCKFDSYDSWKVCVREYYGSLKNYRPYLLEQVEIVQAFDQLCDTLVDVLKELIKESQKRRECTHQWHATKRHEHYVYDTLEDLKYHKEYMLQNGARLFDESDTDLYAEYEVNVDYDGEVVVEE